MSFLVPEIVGEAVTCAECGRMKKPIGRDSVDNGLCDRECPGYDQPPHVGSLWPGEAGPAGIPWPWIDDALERPLKPSSTVVALRTKP